MSQGSGRVRGLLWAAPRDGALVADRLQRVEGLDLEVVEAREDLAARVGEADALIFPIWTLDAELKDAILAAPSRLRLLQLLNVGYEQLSGIGLPDRITVATAGASIAPVIADHALALVLGLARSLPASLHNQAAAVWDREAMGTSVRLGGTTAVIFGYGAIGREVAQRLRAFGVRVIGVNRSGRSDAAVEQVVHPDRLDEVLAEADLVVIAAELNAATRGRFDAETLARMKAGAWLVNVSRGKLVDTSALVAALESGQLGGAGLDVMDPEPLPADHPLWRAPNTIITPHVASGGASELLADFVSANVARFVRGEPLQAVVRP